MNHVNAMTLIGAFTNLSCTKLSYVYKAFTGKNLVPRRADNDVLAMIVVLCIFLAATRALFSDVYGKRENCMQCMLNDMEFGSGVIQSRATGMSFGERRRIWQGYGCEL